MKEACIAKQCWILVGVQRISGADWDVWRMRTSKEANLHASSFHRKMEHFPVKRWYCKKDAGTEMLMPIGDDYAFLHDLRWNDNGMRSRCSCEMMILEDAGLRCWCHFIISGRRPVKEMMMRSRLTTTSHGFDSFLKRINTTEMLFCFFC